MSLYVWILALTKSSRRGHRIYPQIILKGKVVSFSQKVLRERKDYVVQPPKEAGWKLLEM